MWNIEKRIIRIILFALLLSSIVLICNEEELKAEVGIQKEHLVINELYTNLTENNEELNRTFSWLEIYNPTEKTIKIVDSFFGFALKERCTPPHYHNITIKPKEYLLFLTYNNFTSFRENWTVPEDVRLYYVDNFDDFTADGYVKFLLKTANEDWHVEDKINYGFYKDRPRTPKVPLNHSVARYRDGVDSNDCSIDFYNESVPTPGAPNRRDFYLSISELKFGKNNPKEGEIVPIEVKVKNIGNISRANIGVKFFTEKEFIGISNITYLEEGESETVSIGWKAACGEHTISAFVYGRGVTKEITVKETFSKIETEILISPNPILKKGKSEILLKLTNNGEKDAKNLLVQIYLDKKEIKKDTISELKIGEGETIKFEYEFEEVGDYNITVFVSEDGELKEEKESEIFVIDENEKTTSFYLDSFLILAAVSVLVLFGGIKRRFCE